MTFSLYVIPSKLKLPFLHIEYPE